MLLVSYILVTGCIPTQQALTGDADRDGIPDEYEAAGQSYLDMPLYDWGARPNQTDLFIEIDYMDSTNSGSSSPVRAC